MSAAPETTPAPVAPVEEVAAPVVEETAAATEAVAAPVEEAAAPVEAVSKVISNSIPVYLAFLLQSQC